MWDSDRPSRFVLTSTLIAALLLAGCGLKALDAMKDAHREGQFAEVAGMEVDCDPADDRCHQMHLLKGDACYALGREAEAADADSTAEARFRCATRHLGMGIRQTEAQSGGWAIAGKDQAQWYVNRAESLRQLQDLLAGDSARAVSGRLLDFGQRFQTVAPDAAAPPFYVATARYALLQPRLIDAPAGDAEVCTALNEIHAMLAEAPAPDSAGPVRENLDGLRRQIDSQRSRLDCSS